MIERFQGDEGGRRTLAALRTQVLINGDDVLAKQLANVSSLLEFKPGQSLISQDAEDTHLFLLLAGKVRVEVNGRPIAYRLAGTHVGEMALIDCKARRSASIIAEETTVAATITEPDFVRVADEFPVLWRRISIELCDRLRNRNQLIRSPNEIPYVFICSSAESLYIVDQIQLGLAHHKSNIIRWTDEVFGLSRQTMEDLEREVSIADFAIAVIAGEDIVRSRKRQKAAPRDNVIFELGLFMGRLGRERTVMLVQKGLDLKLPSDLNGLAPLFFEPPDDRTDQRRLSSAFGPACTQIKSLMDRLKPI